MSIADMVEQMLERGIAADLIVLAVRTAEMSGINVQDMSGTMREYWAEQKRSQRGNRNKINGSAKANDVAASTKMSETCPGQSEKYCDLTSLSSSSLTSSEVKKERGTASVVEGRKRGTRLPEDWQPREEDREVVRKLGLDPTAVRDEFVDFWIAVPGVRGEKLNWFSTYRNRARDLARRGRPMGLSNGQTPRRNGITEVLNRKLEELEREEGSRHEMRPPSLGLLPFRRRE